MKKLICFTILISLEAWAQTDKSFISKGNEFYLQLKFDLAEIQYRRALEMSPGNTEAKYNLANALMQQEKYKEANELYNEVAASNNEKLLAAAYYNAGVSYTRQEDLPNSIESYKSALRINPNDHEARENLQKALSELKQQQQQQNQQQNSRGGGGGMSQNEADKKLRELQEKEKELQQRLQSGRESSGGGSGKDW